MLTHMHGNIFTFILFGKRLTPFLGIQGNNFILDGRLQDLNAENIYGPLTKPIFGEGIAFDCPNSKLMEQKRFIKFGLTSASLQSYAPLVEAEVLDYIGTASAFQGREGVIDIAAAMAEITIFTAGRTLQGKEVRAKLTAEFAHLYRELDLGFNPINFLMPWIPLPHNRRRDAAHATMKSIYLTIIDQRRTNIGQEKGELDMIDHLMGCVYKNGTPMPDSEVASMMITILMAGQHTSASASSWIMLRLASRPDMVDKLYQEQVQKLGHNRTRPIQYEDLAKLKLLQSVIKETLRVHSSIHTLMRQVTNPIPVPNTDYVVTADKVLVASPTFTHLMEEYFPDPLTWDPNRWIESADEDAEDEKVDYGFGVVSKGTCSPYLPFSAGRHRCVGEKFAYMNLLTIVSIMIRHFTFSTVDGKETVPPTDYTSMFSRPVQPAEIRWKRRLLHIE
ncbi:hypothetical protein NQ176_g6875 [Zarea fungicola]|uniref:Uncharacterized protein n=1 Tax=Zarea fungicola TaxID=93591 RepID=A0ACC1N2D4_9HYPO|nr:hypothetical protein NQ176_g6875 [Lecanicillium fungicola]